MSKLKSEDVALRIKEIEEMSAVRIRMQLLKVLVSITNKLTDKESEEHFTGFFGKVDITGMSRQEIVQAISKDLDTLSRAELIRIANDLVKCDIITITTPEGEEFKFPPLN